MAIEKSLRKVKGKKAVRPDGISGKILNACYKELSFVFQRLFQWSLDSCQIPRLWKSSIVIPIPKISKPMVLNDFRPVALTPIVI